MKAFEHDVGEMFRIIIGGFGNGGGQDKAASHIDGGMLFHPEESLLVLHRPVGFKIPLEAGFLLGLSPFILQLIELVVANWTACRTDNPGIHSHPGLDGKAQTVELFQQFMENLFQLSFSDPFPESADNRMIG